MLALLLAVPLMSLPAPDGVLAIRADRILTGAGNPVLEGYLVVRDGKIAAVGATEAPAGAVVLDYPGATLCAGFIDPITALGSEGQLSETARAATPAARAAETLRADHSSFRAAAQGGLTTVGLSPSSENVIGGRMALVQTQGDSARAHLIGEGPLRMTLTSSALLYDRPPTSRMGAMALLRELLADGSLAATGPVLIEARTADEIRMALSLKLAAEQGRILLASGEVQELAGELAAAKVGVILGPFGVGSATRELRAAAVLEAASVRVAFTGDGRPGTLRLTAALAVREGLSADAALAAITEVPAQLLGIQDRGALAVGKRADFVVFQGHPLDLSARIEQVFVGGVPVERESD